MSVDSAYHQDTTVLAGDLCSKNSVRPTLRILIRRLHNASSGLKA